jgi:hypothetical protein
VEPHLLQNGVQDQKERFYVQRIRITIDHRLGNACGLQLRKLHKSPKGNSAKQEKKAHGNVSDIPRSISLPCLSMIPEDHESDPNTHGSKMSIANLLN